MERDRQPRREGFTFTGPPVDARGLVRKYPLPVGAAASLAEMAADYYFFTPAALYLFGDFTDAPLIDFVCELREDVRFYYRKFNRPVFRGLERNGDSDWNHVLWAVGRPYWELLRDFLLSVTLSFREEGRLVRIAEQELSVLDPLTADRAVLYRPDMPLVPVSAFGVNGSRFRAAFRAGASPLMEPPGLRFHPPDKEVRVYAQALFGGHGNPLDVVQNFRNKEADRARDTGDQP